MNLLVFLAIWALIWYIPIPPTKFRILSKRRLISLAIGLILFAFNAMAYTPFSLFVYFLIFSRSLVAIIEYFIIRSLKDAFIERTFKTGSELSGILLKLKRRKSLLAIVTISLFLTSLIGIGIFGEAQRVSNANYFKGFTQQGSGLPFRGTIPDNMVRLVTQELAFSIARRHMSEFGSNTQVLDCHVTKSPEGKLVWIATISSTNVIAENYIKGFIVIDANEPTTTPKIFHTEFDVGEGLWWDRNIPFRNYIEDTSKTYGVAYPTWDLDTNNIVYVVTRSNIGFDYIQRYETPLAYNEKGELQYQPSSLTNIPNWITQVYDEDWLEHMTNEMGEFRRGTGFDYFAGGFLWIIPPSRDRFQMTEDTRYVVDPETTDVVALVCVNPVENQRSLSGVFKATRQGIIFYDFKLSNYISGMTAEDLVEGRLPKPATGNYYAVMPLLYGVEINPGNSRLAWYVPIYWYEDSGETDQTVYLAGFAIVDAQDTNKLTLSINQEGITSEQLVKQTRLDFINLFGANITNNIELNATVSSRYEYVLYGSTHIVLNIDNDTYPWIEATPNDLPNTQWNQLLSTQPNQKIQAQIEKRNDRWIITTFKNTP